MHSCERNLKSVAELQIALLAAVHAALLLFQGYVVVLMVTTVHMI